ncbi:MAG TPA: hypothetical protein VH593_24960 [Ktedonobacteraceae bacterium]|jgi:hypothetical protein
MTSIVWDQIGEKIYQTGVDRGVLYLHDGRVVPWNGITSVEETATSELKSFYMDGVKYLNNLTPGDFSGKLRAFTYPEEFDQVNGIANPAPGLDYYDQPHSSFNLSYRTSIGNDIESIQHGYKIHILYNVIANPDTYVFATLKVDAASAVVPVEFAWTLSGTPPPLERFRPTVHISIDSTDTPPDLLETLEDVLYGTDTSNPRLPTIDEIAEYFGYLGALIIIDHGDGTWSAIDESNTYITMINDTTFQIDNADATYLDATTYTISSTNVASP